MKIIRYFKANRRGKDLSRHISPGDVIQLNGVLYMMTREGRFVSEFGTNYSECFTEMILDEMIQANGQGEWLHREIGDDIISTMLVAEGGIYERM